MKRTLIFVAGATLAFCPMVKAQDAVAQVERGRQLFARVTKGTACASCHSMEGVGTAVGPDLKKLAGVIGPRGLATTIQMTMTCYVQEVTLKSGRTFPGMEKSKANGVVEMWDLSKFPANLVTVKESEIVSQKTNSTWGHPPTTAGYTDQELADIIGYLKAASTGTAKTVTPEELQ